MKKLTQKLHKSALEDGRLGNVTLDNITRLKERFDNNEDDLKDYLLQYTILSILTASSIGIDLLDTLENYYKGQSIRIWIPIVPPGINATYGVNCKSKKKVYKTKEAKQWEKDAYKLILNAANLSGFLIDKEKDKLAISILIKGSRHDVDAPIKMIIDTVACTLEFDDEIVMSVQSKVRRATDDRGVLIEIEKLND